MNCVRVENDRFFDVTGEKLKKNVDKNTFLSIILEAIGEFKKTDYKNTYVRDYFYNIVFETIFSMEEEHSYVLKYIGYFKNNVPFQLIQFESLIRDMKNSAVLSRPYLLRDSNHDEIEIRKAVYSIGSDKNMADYIVRNPLLGNRHAEIITKENHYYVCDKGSANRTFINNREVPAEEVVEIFNGAELKFANEKFTFFIKN